MKGQRPGFEISKSEGHHTKYLFHFADPDRPTGFVNLGILKPTASTLGDFQRVFDSFDFPLDTKVAYIWDFKPNGDIDEDSPEHKSYARQGVGKIAMGYIVSEARDYGAKLICGETRKVYAKRFLSKLEEWHVVGVEDMVGYFKVL